jgi:hypothetical protein
MSEEELLAVKEKSRLQKKNWRANRTPEQKAAAREKRKLLLKYILCYTNSNV